MTRHLQSDIKNMETLKKPIKILKIHTSIVKIKNIQVQLVQRRHELCGDDNHKRNIVIVESPDVSLI